MYYFPEQPPYLILLIGFLIALTSGLALSGTLKVIVGQWPEDSTENTQSPSSLKQLFVPFLGITSGVSLFLSSGLQIFGFPSSLALGIGLPVSLLTCLLVWLQLGSLLTFAKSQGMQALDLDS
ncbi:hypothetical protein VB620_05495 [Nodularia harveyana UHCC-0300]|uniref:Uncharacterized protein n=1 Tax=Nodularia harveyana UHCC-0300 TaxID=2974287 RepID=A0ABU5UB82_9CYAN|nr:hypothetical protein [Nodularia harveyana]MEA5580793.1 hypothetical protein [Nodularia harveyana UHCC-0300]